MTIELGTLMQTVTLVGSAGAATALFIRVGRLVAQLEQVHAELPKLRLEVSDLQQTLAHLQGRLESGVFDAVPSQ